MLEIEGKVQSINYKPLLCEELPKYSIEDLEEALKRTGPSIIRIDKNEIALSRWVSAKRTRSYPYTHVYDSMGFGGKKLTVIPIFKDEGLDGDRDFLQFDTVSLMTLLNVNVIVAYYADAEKNEKYLNKITNQGYDVNYVSTKIKENLIFLSDALHWNREQLKNLGEIADLAMKSYSNIAQRLGVKMHSESSAIKKISILKEGGDFFKNKSRQNAREAQKRESLSVQPKEFLEGEKGRITITNFYNGYYAFTVDEVAIDGNKVYLIEAKHTRDKNLPSIYDIKDALLKLIIYTNLKTVSIGEKTYEAVPMLKLTSGKNIPYEELGTNERKILSKLKSEAESNGFKVNFNGKMVV